MERPSDIMRTALMGEIVAAYDDLSYLYDRWPNGNEKDAEIRRELERARDATWRARMLAENDGASRVS